MNGFYRTWPRGGTIARWILLHALGAVGALVIIGAGAWGTQRLIWLMESTEIMKEAGPPVAVDYQPGTLEPRPRDGWVGGQTVYIRRNICLYKIPTSGYTRRWLADPIKFDLASVPISVELYPPYDETGRPLSLPWCGPRLSPPITLPSSALAPGPVTLGAEHRVNLNPEHPDVIIPLLPVTLRIVTTPVRQEVEAIRQLTVIQQGKIALIQKELELAISQNRKQAQQIKDGQAYLDVFDAYMRAQGFLPKARPR